MISEKDAMKFYCLGKKGGRLLEHRGLVNLEDAGTRTLSAEKRQQGGAGATGHLKCIYIPPCPPVSSLLF